MKVATKLTAYAAALAVLATGAWVTGAVAGPEPSTVDKRAKGHAGMGADAAPEAHGGAHSAKEAELPGGLATAQSGYTFLPASTVVPSGPAEPFAFRIIGPNGKPVTRYDVEHEKRLHLIVVRRDTANFQHVHPKLGSDGTWRVPLNTSQPGSYRAFADFTPAGGEGTTLGVDFSTPGDFQPRNYANTRQATVDGYQVELDGTITPGASSKVTLQVRKNGKPVTDLQPYLGAYGHLVALRGGDLGYLHVHPEGSPGDGKTKPGPDITFFVEAPTAGTYRLFLDFKHNDTVRTAEFTVTAGKPGSAPATESHGHTDEQPHG